MKTSKSNLITTHAGGYIGHESPEEFLLPADSNIIPRDKQRHAFDQATGGEKLLPNTSWFDYALAESLAKKTDSELLLPPNFDQNCCD